MAVTFIQRLLNALFSRKKDNDAIGKGWDDTTAGEKKSQKNIKSKASLENVKHKKGTKAREAEDKKLKLEIASRAASRVKNVVAETEAETEERIKSCAVEIKKCIDLINSSGKSEPDKSKRVRKRSRLKDRKARKNTVNRKTSGSKTSDKRMKSSKQDVSPAEMVKLLVKAEKNVSKAVVQAKEQDDNKSKGRKRTRKRN
jgi:hypothetical protein